MKDDLDTNKFCPVCRQEKTKIKRTNPIFICENPKCQLKINLSKVENWKRERF